MIRALGALALGLAMTGPGQAADPRVTVLTFDQLSGWEEDNLDQALKVFQSTCTDMKDPDWSSLCALAQEQKSARTFFELFFRPTLIEDGAPALFTGYFEPELDGSLTRTDRFDIPIYRKPPELRRGSVWLSRSEIEESAVLEGRGLEIAWVDDPVEAFFLQIQGSGRINLQDGSSIRVGYSAANGHNYRSIGEELVRRGVYKPHQVSAQVLRSWVGRNPQEGKELLQVNPSFVFFRKLAGLADDLGPLGAMNRPITAMRTIAVDPRFTPLGAPVWIEKAGSRAMNRLMIAQDTGSAIKGAQRADIFFGTGDAAGRRAGKIRDPGRMIVLMPIQRAYAMLSEGSE